MVFETQKNTLHLQILPASLSAVFLKNMENEWKQVPSSPTKDMDLEVQAFIHKNQKHYQHKHDICINLINCLSRAIEHACCDFRHFDKTEHFLCWPHPHLSDITTNPRMYSTQYIRTQTGSCMVFEIEASMPCPPTEDKNELQGLRRIKTMKVPNLPVLTLRLLLLKFFTVVMQRHLKGTQIYMKLIKLHQQKYPAEMKV